MTSEDARDGIRIATGTSPIPILDDEETTAEVDAPPGTIESTVGHATWPSDLAMRAEIQDVDLDALSREKLEAFINLCHHLVGDTPLCTFAGITDDELREMARRARDRLGRRA